LVCFCIVSIVDLEKNWRGKRNSYPIRYKHLISLALPRGLEPLFSP
jgi:hypothetical protein